MFVCCECCVLSGRGLCDELITRPEESYRLWCVVVCDLETSIMRRPWPVLGRSATGRKSCCLWDNVEKYCTAGQATDDSVIGRMRSACWIPKSTKAHSEYAIFLVFSTATLVMRTRFSVTLIRT
jgi:hypothetical protein